MFSLSSTLLLFLTSISFSALHSSYQFQNLRPPNWSISMFSKIASITKSNRIKNVAQNAASCEPENSQPTWFILVQKHTGCSKGGRTCIEVLRKSFRAEEDNIEMESEHIGLCVDWIKFNYDNIQWRIIAKMVINVRFSLRTMWIAVKILWLSCKIRVFKVF
jgi:hypothetical protein